MQIGRFARLGRRRSAEAIKHYSALRRTQVGGIGIRRGKDICYNPTVPPTKHRTATRQRLVQLHMWETLQRLSKCVVYMILG